MGIKVYENLTVKSYNMFLLSILMEPRNSNLTSVDTMLTMWHVQPPQVIFPTRPMMVRLVISGV